MNDERHARRKPQLRPADIIDTAVRLTARKGLYGWTVRDIALESGASMSSIYHHVGGKDEIMRKVVEEVLSGTRMPPGDVDWRKWFTETMLSLRKQLAPYPGVAHWMMLHGPFFSDSLRGLDVAIDLLESAGFGADTGKVYGTIFNAALSSIAFSDFRRGHAVDGFPGHEGIIRGFADHAPDSPGSRVLLETMAPFARDADAAEAAGEEFYRFLLSSLLNGIARTLGPQD
ncbi:TetR/AcrR family transcriptional regulator [Corynebacterium hansenii]|uniref:TetR/AcrR family transcriptional regulator n=1 Tax=Corynebacterium hansenii TaxID=394964 RepID=A0ABV7ZKZ2_9CORY|nr:helix-turn-helix domain-containing protein [Corynebacterium hansenii]WJY99236.1 Transcriptional regulator, TetR family [Corynebacterium hansenii]